MTWHEPTTGEYHPTELTLATIRSQLEAIMQSLQTSPVTLNLSRVERIDVAGMQLLTAIRSSAANCNIAIRDANATTISQLRRCGLDESMILGTQREAC